MEVARFDAGGSAMEPRTSDAGLFAGFKYKLTMLLTQVKWQQEREGERRRHLEDEFEKKKLEAEDKARRAEELEEELDRERSRADCESRLQVANERISDGKSERERKLEEELSLLRSTSKAQLEELRLHGHDLEERLMAKCGELSLAKEKLQASTLQMSSFQREASRLGDMLGQLEAKLKEQEQCGKQLEQRQRPIMSADERVKERMKELQTRCNRLMVEGYNKDKELAAAKEALATASMDHIRHVSEAASLRNTLTITQTELYSARNALQAAEQELKSVNAAFAGSRAALDAECRKRNEIQEQLCTLTRLERTNATAQETPTTAVAQSDEKAAQDRQQAMEKELQGWRARVEDQLKENIRLKEALDAASTRVSDFERAEAANEASRRQRRHASTQTPRAKDPPALFHQKTSTEGLVPNRVLFNQSTSTGDLVRPKRLLTDQATSTSCADDAATPKNLFDASTSTDGLLVHVHPVKAPLFCASTSTKDLLQGPAPGLEDAADKDKHEDPPAATMAAPADADAEQSTHIQEQQDEGSAQADALLELRAGTPTAGPTGVAPQAFYSQEAATTTSPSSSSPSSKQVAQSASIQEEHESRPSLVADEAELPNGRATPVPAAATPAVERPASDAACRSQEEHSAQLPADQLPAVHGTPISSTFLAAGSLEGVKPEQAFLRPPATPAEADGPTALQTIVDGAAPDAGGLLSPATQAAADAALGLQEEDSLNVTFNMKLPPQLDPDQLFEYYKSILESQGPGGPSQQLLGADVKPWTDVGEGAGTAQGGGDTLAEGHANPREEGEGAQVAQSEPRDDPANDPLPSPKTMHLLDILPTQLLGISNVPHWGTDNVTAADPQEVGAEVNVSAESSPSEADPEAFLTLIKDSSAGKIGTSHAVTNGKRGATVSTSSCVLCSAPAEGTMVACEKCSAGVHKTCLEQLQSRGEGDEDWCTACTESQAKKRVKPQD